MGPLTGLRVIEFAGLGPAPFAAMLLADMGADVVRLERQQSDNLLGIDYDVLNRGKRAVAVDLKTPDGIATALELLSRADVLIEGFRPGVMERLGLGPEVCWQVNPALVYGRMTGWGQDGPLARSAGHDINYIAISGVLSAMGERDGRPAIPVNLLGDFGGGAMYLAFGIMAALYECRTSGKGQVVDAAICDGTAHLSTMLHGLMHNDRWQDRRGENLLDGAAPHYNTYQCADGEWISIGPLEPKFHGEFLRCLRLQDDEDFQDYQNPECWPRLKKRLATLFAQRDSTHWRALLEGTDCCVAPVLGLRAAAEHPHNASRVVFETHDGCVQPAPAPRFSRTPGRIQGPPPAGCQPGAEVLRQWQEEDCDQSPHGSGGTAGDVSE
ncbi:CaiB/BaiF CoA transferase family protein [Granulosicoccus sp. 3-233]|uniref:CaiB/BaiF CoA transferase family protein n=1 Tax=Granulosicoccus sp. 3-233 TaxID=3417969 RepID=UPI003D3575DD